MTELFVNDVSTTLASSATSGTTTLTIASATGLPAMVAGNILRARLEPATPTGAFEIVNVTARSGTTLTVVRGQEGTAASAWASGDRVSFVVTAATLSSFAALTGVASPGQFSATSGTVLAACETTTGWTVSGGLTPAVTTESTLKTTGSASVRVSLTVFQGVEKGYIDLTAAQAVGSYQYVLVDVAWSPSSSMSLEAWDVNNLYISDTTALGGNTSRIRFPAIPQNTFITVAIPVGSLTSVRSIGMIGDVGGKDLSAGRRAFTYFDNIRFGNLTEFDAALTASSTVVVPAAFTPSITQEVKQPTTGKGVVDLRPSTTVLSSLGGVKYLREWQVPEDGSVDVSAQIGAIFGQLSPGDTLVFPAGKTFVIDKMITVKVPGITIDFQWSKLVTTLWRGGSNTVIDAMFRMMSSEVTLKNLGLVGGRTRTTTGSALQNDLGSASTVSTTKTLAAQTSSVRAANNSNSLTPFYARLVPPMMSVAHQALVNAADPNFEFGNAFVFTLSDSAQVASDCVIEVVPDERQPLTTLTASAVALDTTLTVASTTGFVIGDRILVGSELMGVSDIVSSTKLEVSGRYASATHTSGEVVAVVLAARTLTLTATPTDYMLTWTPRDLRRVGRVRVRKLTGTTNTITVTSLFEYGYVQYDGNHDSAPALRVECSNLTIDGYLCEGVSTDPVDLIRSALVNPAGITVRNLFSRGCGRQGISFNAGKDITLDGFVIMCFGRSGIDIEPFSLGNSVDGIVIRNGEIYNATNYFIAANNWARITDFTIENVHCFGARVGGFIGGARKFRMNNVSFVRASEFYGAIGSDAMKLNAINAVVSGFLVDDNVTVGSAVSSFANTGQLAETTVSPAYPGGSTTLTVNDVSGLTVGQSVDVVSQTNAAWVLTATITNITGLVVTLSANVILAGASDVAKLYPANAVSYTSDDIQVNGGIITTPGSTAATAGVVGSNVSISNVTVAT